MAVDCADRRIVAALAGLLVGVFVGTGCGRTELFPARPPPSSAADAGAGGAPESADLAMLSVSVGSLSPAFTTGVVEYGSNAGVLADTTT